MADSANSRPRRILPVLVFAQFAGTSLWFASNAVLGDLRRAWGLGAGAVATLTSAVQLGFIAGTLVFALLSVADRLPARAVFLASALLGAAANGAVVLGAGSTPAAGAKVAAGVVVLVLLRGAVGFFLAGIYPVGMKIAASWYAEGLGRALGLLVGALVLGTAFPHALRIGGAAGVDWRAVTLGVSALAAVGGLLLFASVPAGPHLPARSRFDPRALPRIFSAPRFRAAAFGYFGHMWELYAFWALVPALLTVFARRAGVELDVSLWSFIVIGAGALGCGVGGLLALRVGSARVAAYQVGLSGVLCLVAPFLGKLPLSASLAVMVVWGVAVVGDSPQFSALNAVTAPRELVGTALTIVTSVGFLITIPSIQLVTRLAAAHGADKVLPVLAPGPMLGLLSLRRLLRDR